MYTDEVCAKAIESFQERLMEADNLMKDDNGRMNYEICWKAMRKEGPMILNVAKHLFTMHINRHHRSETLAKNGRYNQQVLTYSCIYS